MEYDGIVKRVNRVIDEINANDVVRTVANGADIRHFTFSQVIDEINRCGNVIDKYYRKRFILRKIHHMKRLRELYFSLSQSKQTVFRVEGCIREQKNFESYKDYERKNKEFQKKAYQNQKQNNETQQRFYEKVSPYKEFEFFSTCENFEQVKCRYRELAKKFHPDSGGSINDFKRLNEEYSRIKRAV